MSDTLKIKIARDHEPVRRPSEEAGQRMLVERADGSLKDTQLIYPGEVVEVPNTRYWRRRIIVGDVVEVTEPKQAAAAPARASRKEE